MKMTLSACFAAQVYDEVSAERGNTYFIVDETAQGIDNTCDFP